MVMLLVIAAMVLDFGLVRLDRQTNKSATDSAATAGLQGLNYKNDGRIYSYRGACAAFEALKANAPDLAGLNWTDCSDATKLSTVCKASDSTTHADFVQSVGGYTVEIHNPYLVTSGNFQEETLPTLQNDPGSSVLAGCDQLAVVVQQTRKPGLGSLATSSDLVSRIRSVGRVTIDEDSEGAVALLLLEQHDCDAILINGSNSYVKVKPVGDAPGFIHSDSLGDICSGNQRILLGDHANGILAQKSPAASGLIRIRAFGVTNPDRSFDSTTNVVAEGGAPSAGGLVTRLPVDDRYMDGVRAALADFAAQSQSDYTVKNCGASKAALEGVTGKLWINCTSGNQTFDTGGLTLAATAVYFNAKTVTANDLSMPNATRVYIKGDPGNNGTALGVSTTTFRMHQGAASGICPSTYATRARLVVGAGSIVSNSGGDVRLCGTTVVLAGGSSTGCIPLSKGDAPSAPSCNGRISLGGPTDWTAPNAVPGPVTDKTVYNDLEDLALWTEAPGSHDVGGGGVMRLSGVFFVPNGDFKVHGGAAQDVRNSQYIARRFRADGGSALEMAPNPYDVVTIPVIGGFFLVR